jgi:hypothetical protein
MNFMSRNPALLLLLLCLPAMVGSQPVTVIGDSPCAQWSQDPAAAKASWLLGYLSGMNMVWSGEGKPPHNPLGSFTTAAQAFRWMDGFCKLNPGKKISEGANVLFFELAGQKK